MIINFENYGHFFFTMNLDDDNGTFTYEQEGGFTFKEIFDFLEYKMKENPIIATVDIIDCETGEIVATVERDEEDVAEEDWYSDEWEPDCSECGFNPYSGCYDLDC